MSTHSKTLQVESSSEGSRPQPTPRYEPPRILSKRSVRHVTLVSGQVGGNDPAGPGGPGGGHVGGY
jgi:hypothetical protein